MAELQKLLFVTHNFPPMKGGIPNFSLQVCRGLSGLGLDVLVLTGVKSMEHSSETFSVVNFRENPYLRKARRFSIHKHLKKAILQFKPEALFLASIHPYAFFVERLCRQYQIPFAVALHGLDILRIIKKDRLLPFEAWAARRTLNNANTLIAHTDYVANLARKLTGRDLAVDIIPSGVDSEFYKPGAGDRLNLCSRLGISHDDPFLLLSVSVLGPRKGHVQVFKALEMLKDKYPQLFYLIAGSGAGRENLEREVTERKLNDRVFFLGRISSDELLKSYQSSDLFILTSRTLQGTDIEGFGVVYLEANACGLPVIAGNTGGVPGAVKDGETGLLVDPENPEEIANAIEKLMTDAELQKTMGENGRKWAEELDWNILIPRYKAALEEIVR